VPAFSKDAIRIAGALEVKPGDRRALRRSVRMPCDVLADVFDDAVAHVMTDLSPFGAWIDTTYPLDPGAELLVSLTPPGRAEGEADVVLAGHVARASLGRRRGEIGRSGMGVSFDASELERAQLTMALRGLPPPLPSQRVTQLESGIVWVDMPVIIEEEYDDRTNIFSMLETVACFLDDAEALIELDAENIVAAAPLLTGGYPSARWRISLVS